MFLPFYVTCLALTFWYDMRKTFSAELLPSSLAEART